MASTSPSLSIPEIQAKITQARFSIDSLDIEGQHYQNVKSQLGRTLANLEVELAVKQAEEQTRRHQEDLKFLADSAAEGPRVGSSASMTSQTQRPYSSYATSPFPSDFSASPKTQDGSSPHFASDGILTTENGSGLRFSSPAGLLTDEPLDAFQNPQLDIEESSGSGSSPDQGSSVPSPGLQTSHNPRKRQRDSLNLPPLSPSHVDKTMRATPSPAITGVTTPSSVDSFDLPEDPEFMRLIGGDPKVHYAELREDQIAREKLLRERAEQERRDEEFARQLSQQENEYASSLQHSQPWGGQSSTSRATAQTIFDTKGRIRRPDLPFSSSPIASNDDAPLPYHRPIMQENSLSTASNQVGIKKEQARLPVNPSLGMCEFVDLGSGDELEVADEASSDPVEINPDAWHEFYNGVKSQRNLPWMNQTGSSSARFDLSNQNAPYSSGSFVNQYQSAPGFGGTSVYNNTPTWPGPVGSAQQYESLDQGYGVYSGLAPIYDTSSFGYGQIGTSSNPQVILENEFNFNTLPKHDIVQNNLHGFSINPDDPNNRELLERYTDRVNYLTNDPTRTSAEIKSLLENIRPDEDLPAENREGTPNEMTYPLMEHQKLGLAWMKNMEEGSNKGGILADDMGLGKTIQALALMVSRRSTDPKRKTTLIVAPVALMKQWEREISQKLKNGRENRLSCFILHGVNRHTTWEQLKTYDVVLTTFGTLANEVKRKDKIDADKRMNPNWRPTGKADHLPLLGEDCKWYRVIIDEAQCIKNKHTKAAIGAAQLQALTRFCMSGTPMMNNVGELYSLIHFLRIKPYNQWDKFNVDFVRPLKQGYESGKERAMQKLQALLKAILLRRTKKSKIDGAPILSLPERTTNTQHAVFSNDEMEFYRALETRTQLQFNRYLKAGTVGRNYSNVLVLLLRLRQACCHPHLIKDFGMSSGGVDVSLKDMLALAKQLAPEVVARIKEQGAANEQSALECPVCMDMAENATIFIPCGHSTCSECFARISDPAQAIAGGDGDEGQGPNIKCPNCRGKIVPTKVIDHNAFKRVYIPEAGGPDGFDTQAEDNSIDESDSDSDSGESLAESDDSDDLKDFVVPDDHIDSDSEMSGGSAEDSHRKHKGPLETPNDKVSNQKEPKKGRAKSKVKVKVKGKSKAKQGPRKTLAQLKKEGARNVRARRQYLRRLEREWETSGKIEKVMEILHDTQNRQENEKTIIFSQFTSLLDLLEIPISRQLWGYKRYDGSMNSDARNEAVIEFSDNPRCKIMLVSLKAGNSGLNLVAASQVIIFDPFWNPYIEEQAIDRAHRIGQMKPVQVHRILVPDTVEDRILALQEKKRELIEGALDEKASQSIGRLGERELAFLFVSVLFLITFNTLTKHRSVHFRASECEFIRLPICSNPTYVPLQFFIFFF